MSDTKQRPYEKPQLRELGSIQELTLLTPKVVNPNSDGFSFNGSPLNTS